VILALSATAIVILVLLWEVMMPRVDEYLDGAAPAARSLERPRLRPGPRAPRRAARPRPAEVVRQRRGVGRCTATSASSASGGRRGGDGVEYAYLVYPHKPIVAYLPQTGVLLNEYCVEFPDQTRPYGSARLPDSDDVLAKWMALTGDERRLIANANMHLIGRQVDPKQVRRDLWRLAQWERQRLREERPEGVA
jgi:hypothetical protein